MYKIINAHSVLHKELAAVIHLPAGESYGFAYEAWLAEGNTPEPADPPHVKTAAEIVIELTAELEAHYDSVARVKHYDNRLTCALRAGYAGPFQLEGQTFAIWMDTCNVYAYGAMSDCLAGTRAIPSGPELVSELPVSPW